MASRRLARLLCAFAATLALACSRGEEAPPAAPPVATPGADAAAAKGAAVSDAQVDAPPGEVKDTTLVRCLVDTPDGCTGCDQGDSCVYEQKTRYDCVYILYGTDCSK